MALLAEAELEQGPADSAIASGLLSRTLQFIVLTHVQGFSTTTLSSRRFTNIVMPFFRNLNELVRTGSREASIVGSQALMDSGECPGVLCRYGR